MTRSKNNHTKVINSIGCARRYFDKILLKGKAIGFVPTMGALHEGHISLIRRAIKENDITVVSIFVNPTQFAPQEDFKKYPRPFGNDVKICRREGVDVIFAPRTEDMYPDAFGTYVSVGGKRRLSDILCGAVRRGHFRGVATVVAKLFNIVRPSRAYFGAKDYQQLKIIERMVQDLNFPVRIVACPTVREPSGLAMSSRNVYLTNEEKERASAIYRIISLAKKNPFEFLQKRGKTIGTRTLEAEIVRRLKKVMPGSKVEYVSILKSKDLSNFEKIAKNNKRTDWRILVAIRTKSGVRLIDNV